MKVLITGGKGLLAPYLEEAFEDDEVIKTSREDCDLTNVFEVKALLECLDPDVVIHAAANTSVENCEKDPLKAVYDNSGATANLASLIKPKTKFVYISTDMVYPDSRGPHSENEVGPVNMYGRSKLSGERAARASPRHLICRTSFFGPSRTPGRKSISDWVADSLVDGSKPVFFSDVFFTPLHMQTLSALIRELVLNDISGTYNLGSSTIMNKAAFAGAVALRLGLLEQFNKADIGPSRFTVRRPKDMSMDTIKIEREGFRMPTLQEEINKL